MTNLTNLPNELLTPIFTFIHPRKVFKLRRLSKRINSILTTTHFALQVLTSTVGPPGPHLDALTMVMLYSGSEYGSTAVSTDFLFAPPAFQEVIAGLYWKHRPKMIQNLRKSGQKGSDWKLLAKIPPAVGLMTSLTHVELTGFDGSIPSEIGMLVNLEILQITDCAFDDAVIPNELGMLMKLKMLAIDNCNISGPFPEVVCSLVGLDRLSLVSNRLYGNIPASIGNLKQLTRLQLSHNNLSGPIPQEIGYIEELDTLDLSHNKLSGSIPQSFSQLGHLWIMHLNNNLLTGEIPREFLENCQTLSNGYPLDFVLTNNVGLHCDESIFPLKL
ncbi:L domain-like protein [Rhizoclosmatium globosum]|uniref:L domain-like protein n=1 Tax=Rhizoclosmatium globosum TaxID=329046 RepID=A0A1Y2CFJ8_9FUNG|nr:L domain-like protein [Rhizoclosmatium globosum]|eukprot:ORY45075.1 L domain-like protein [Rhizoclosmatium globosum]